MPKSLTLIMEVAGCPTACMHCSARGRHYNAMPLDDIASVLGQACRLCSETHLSFNAFPMHEVLNHPEVSEVLKLFKAYLPDGWRLEPIATTGVPLGARDDWREILETAHILGTKAFWFAFHGIEETHDRLVNRVGAYRESCTAVERVCSMKLF